MERRKGSFFLYATLIFLSLILMRSVFFPPADPDPQANGDKQLVEPDENSDLAGENKQDQNSNESKNSNPATNSIDEGVSKKEAEETLAITSGPPRFYSIGELDAEGQYKNLVTLSSQGATVHRVELNARRANGKLLYRDLEYSGAYIGQLETTDSVQEDGTSSGARINVVAPGTPAAKAGLAVDDIITSIDTSIGGEPVGNATQLDEVLSNIKQGVQITVNYRRGSENRSTILTTEEAPLQALAPIPGDSQLLGDNWLKSFQISLRLQKGGVKQKWPELDEALRTGNWETEVVSQDEVRFKRTLTKSQLAKFDIEGPLVITKTFRSSRNEAGDTNAANHNFHFLLDLDIKNLGSKPQEVTLQLVGPTGTTIEGWWYQNKIHGRSSALFYTAGSRDIAIGTQGIPFSFWGGPEIVAQQKSNRFTFVMDPSYERSQRTLKFASVDTQYFNVALIPENDGVNEPLAFYSGYAQVASRISESKKELRTTDITYQLYSEPIMLEAVGEGDSSFSQSFKIFAGPKDSHVLQEYGLEDTRTFGWFAIFSKPLIWLLELFYSIIPNYGIAIILLTFLVRLAMMPISRRAAKNALMMQYLQPEMKKIAEKYKEDFQKRGEAQNALLKKYNCRPLGGCLLMFVQLPIFIGLYRGISVDIGLRDKALIPGINWCSNLAGPDQLFYWKDWGLPFLFDETGWLGPFCNVLPLVTIVLFLIQQKLFTPPPTDDQQKLMQKMMTFMMIFMGVLFFKVSSGLCIYFITSSIWGILERKLIPKPSLPEHMQIEGKDGAKGDATSASKKEKSQSPYDSDNKKLQDKRKFEKDRRKRMKDRI